MKAQARDGLRIAAVAGVAVAAAMMAGGCALLGWVLPGSISSPAESFGQLEAHKLSKAAEGMWNLHRAIMDAKAHGGWDNDEYPWPRELQEGWRYSVANAAYAYPSIVIIEPARRAQVGQYLRQAILMMKETPMWDDWKRFGFGESPIKDMNIMYKGHLNLMYGLHELITGSREFEAEYKELTGIMVAEYERNRKAGSCCGIVCEPDHYFPQCNAVGMMSLRVYDRIYGADFDKREGQPIADFIKKRLSDPETGLVFRKYHPSHDQAEAYLTAFANGWGLTFLHVYDPAWCEKAAASYERLFVRDIVKDTASFVVDTANAQDMAIYGEAALDVLYVGVMAREYNNPALWGKVDRFLTLALEPAIRDGVTHFQSEEGKESEVITQGYLLWSQVHVGWARILAYPWEEGYDKPGAAAGPRKEVKP